MRFHRHDLPPGSRARRLRLALVCVGVVAAGAVAVATSPAISDSTPDEPARGQGHGHHAPPAPEPLAEQAPRGLAATHRTVTPRHGHHHHSHGSISRKDRATAQLAAAGFQDVKTAEAQGWTSSLQDLGCFQDPSRGGMGVHYINQALLDATVDITKPEALVYELDADAAVAGLVAHEYIVPVDAWTRKSPPKLFGVSFHRHPTLPLYVLHAWLWKSNARGDFDDWNPAVRQCPPGVPIFGQDRPMAH